MSVRRATPHDLETVVALRLALLREYREHPVYGRMRRDAEEVAHEVFLRQLESGHETSFVAEFDGKPVGLLRCVEMISSPLLVPDRYCYVSSVYVVPEYRRRGVLRALFARAREWCLERDLTEMRLHNVADHANAAAAWDALGFTVIEQVRVLRLPTTVDSASVRAGASAIAHAAQHGRP